MIKCSNRWSDDEQEVIMMLRSYRPRIAKLRASIEVKELVLPSSTSRYGEGGPCGSGDNSAERKVHAIVDLRLQMQGDIENQRFQIDLIDEWMKSLPPDEYTVIMRRYVLAQNMEKISMETHWSVRNCWRHHYHGLQRLVNSWHTMAHNFM